MCVWLVTAAAGHAGALFGPPIRVVDFGGAIASATGDFNNDGRMEFVSTASSASSGFHFRVREFLPATQTFTNHTILPGSVIATRQDRFGGDLAVGDINRDGWLDIIVPESNNADGPGRVSWFQNPAGNLGGTWTEHVISTWSGTAGDQVAHMSEVAVGDIDGNGWLDVVTRDVSHGCYVLLRDNIGGWLPRRFIAANPREGLELWNPDGDGDLDILLNGAWLETPADPLNGAYQLRTIAAPWYPAGTGGSAVNDYASKVAAADFNQDGRKDVLISNAEELEHAAASATKPTGIRLYLAPPNPVTGAWTEIILEPQHFSWHTLQVADLDRDGDLDVLSGVSEVGADTTPGRIVAYLNNGGGTNFTAQVVASGTDSQSTPIQLYNGTLADADGDGDADLFAPDNWSSGPIRYYENVSTNQIVAQPPSTPVNLSAVPLSSSQIEVTWSVQSTNETGFKIERKEGEEGDFTEIAQIGAGTTAFADTGLSPDAGYTYRVRAYNTLGESDPTDEVGAWTPPDLYLEWQEAYFGYDPDPEMAGDSADPDKDSIPNLQEYFHGTDPNLHKPGGVFLASDRTRLKIGFTRNLNAIDLTAVVQGADTLNGPWTDLARSVGGGSFIVLVSGVIVTESLTGEIRNLEISDCHIFSDPTCSSRFLRLRLFR